MIKQEQRRELWSNPRHQAAHGQQTGCGRPKTQNSAPAGLLRAIAGLALPDTEGGPTWAWCENSVKPCILRYERIAPNGTELSRIWDEKRVWFGRCFVEGRWQRTRSFSRHFTGIFSLSACQQEEAFRTQGTRGGQAVSHAVITAFEDLLPPWLTSYKRDEGANSHRIYSNSSDWAFLSQTLDADGAAAVTRVQTLCLVLKLLPDEDTGAYCTARARSPIAAPASAFPHRRQAVDATRRPPCAGDGWHRHPHA